MAQVVETRTPFGVKNIKEIVKIKNLFKRIVKRLVVFAIPINEEKVNKILVKINCKKKKNVKGYKDQFK